MFPIRLQGIHVLHEPRILKILVAMFWPFLSNKIRNRVSFFFPFVFLVTNWQEFQTPNSNLLYLTTRICFQLFFHGYCYAALHKQVDPACLPSNYDDWLTPMETMHFSNVFSEKEYSKIFDCFN